MTEEEIKQRLENLEHDVRKLAELCFEISRALFSQPMWWAHDYPVQNLLRTAWRKCPEDIRAEMKSRTPKEEDQCDSEST